MRTLQRIRIGARSRWLRTVLLLFIISISVSCQSANQSSTLGPQVSGGETSSAVSAAAVAPASLSAHGAGAPSDQRAVSDSEHRAAVGDVLQKMLAAWDRHDMDGFGAVFAEDASFINIFGHLLRSRATISHHHDILHQRHFRETTLGAVESEIRLTSRSTAVALIQWRLQGARDPRSDEPVAATTGFMTITLVHANDVWQIVALHNTRTRPIPGRAIH